MRRDDDDILKAALAAPEGDFRAFEQLVQLYRKRIRASCLHLTRDANNADDLTQEVFVKAFFALRDFEGRSSFRHWLFRISVNHCLSHLKSQQRRGTINLGDEAEDSAGCLGVPALAEKALLATEERERVQDILHSMPETLSVALVMREMEELSYEEIATALGIGLSAVKMRIRRARQLFKGLYPGSANVKPVAATRSVGATEQRELL